MNLVSNVVHGPGRIRLAIHVLSLALCAALAGCLLDPVREPQAAADGVRCGAAGSESAEAVFLDVSYDGAGMPAVAPEVCEVRRDTQVTWRGPPGNSVEFAIHFKGPSPVPRERSGVFDSGQDGDRQRVRRVLDGAPAQYDYGVRANGRELDPAIIIR